MMHYIVTSEKMPDLKQFTVQYDQYSYVVSEEDALLYRIKGYVVVSCEYGSNELSIAMYNKASQELIEFLDKNHLV